MMEHELHEEVEHEEEVETNIEEGTTRTSWDGRTIRFRAEVSMHQNQWEAIKECNEALQEWISNGGGEHVPSSLLSLASNIDWAVKNADDDLMYTQWWDEVKGNNRVKDSKGDTEGDSGRVVGGR